MTTHPSQVKIRGSRSRPCVRFASLIPVETMMQLQRHAAARGLTIARMLRTVLADFFEREDARLADFEADMPEHARPKRGFSE